MSGTDDPRETHAEPPLDFDGCHRACRKKGEHTRDTGCEFAPPPEPPKPMVWETYVADDGYPAMRTRDITWEEALAMVTPARDAAHPEDYCHRCGGPNIIWSAPSPLWNEVMRGGDINGPWQYEEIICPTCFAVLAEQTGIAFGWRLVAKDVRRELSTTTPSGRTWSAETWLWEEPRVVDVDSLATEIPEAAVLAVIEVMGWPDDRNDPGGDGAPPAACWTLATDIVRAAHVPLLAEIAFITASSQSMQREFVDVMAERDTARAEAQGLRIDNGHYEDLTVEQDSAARSKIRALTADLAAARAEAANLRDLIRDIRIACLGAQFPSDGDHGRAWAAFEKAGIDERGTDHA